MFLQATEWPWNSASRADCVNFVNKANITCARDTPWEDWQTIIPTWPISVIILNTISKRQDGLGFIGKNGYIFHDSSRCIEVPIGGAYAHMFEDLLQVISYNIPLFSLIQMLKFV